MESVWPQYSSLTEHRSVTLTTIVLDAWIPVLGSTVPVILKHRPQASPGPPSGVAPKESWFMAAVYPDADWPHAAWMRQCLAYAPSRYALPSGAYQESRSWSKSRSPHSPKHLECSCPRSWFRGRHWRAQWRREGRTKRRGKQISWWMVLLLLLRLLSGCFLTAVPLRSGLAFILE